MAWSALSRHDRGYGSKWLSKRQMALQRDHGMCQCDKCGGRRKVANHVHHIVSKAEAKRRKWTDEQTDALENLISLNSECHDRMHGFKKKVQVGIDGWPVKE